jgi:zinc transporter ZupT
MKLWWLCWGRSRLFDDETLFYGFALVSLSVIRVLGQRTNKFSLLLSFFSNFLSRVQRVSAPTTSIFRHRFSQSSIIFLILFSIFLQAFTGKIFFFLLHLSRFSLPPKSHEDSTAQPLRRGNRNETKTLKN